MQALLKDDLQNIINISHPELEQLENKRLLITGGTGFFGKWILSTLLYAEKMAALRCEIVVLSRNPQKFLQEHPQFSDSRNMRFIEGDILNFALPEGPFHWILHGATEASSQLIRENPLHMLNVIVEGTRRIAEFACKESTQNKRMLFLSSGAVYGPQSEGAPPLLENAPSNLDVLNPDSCYGEGKRLAEHLLSLYRRAYGLNFRSARCFAFVGPYLPLDAHYAIGNFMQNCLRGEDIVIKGDGRPLRSYLYASDLVVALLRLLLRSGPEGEAYNVGHGEGLSLVELAKLMAKDHGIQVVVRGEKAPSHPYVPSVQKLQQDFDFIPRVGLKEAIDKTLHFQEGL